MSEVSFWQLLQNNFIEIPIIQRDYVQGSKVHIDMVGKKFLQALKESIENEKPIGLDFIYGSSIKNNTFQPLDGQQRLTTLFLLHWYAAQQQSNNQLDDTIKNTLLKFTYKIRISSRDFIYQLISNNFDYKSIDSNNSISDIIRDSNWFFASWEQDTTITSMLNMLDAIHELFENAPNLWNILTNKQLIRFQKQDLENFGLSDDLYIKMNARGRPLTTFENLKAELEDKINFNNWEKDKTDFKDKFSTKIDGEWTDFLWKLCENNPEIIDQSHMNILSFIVMFSLALKHKKIDSTLKDVIEKFQEGTITLDMVKFIDKEVFENIITFYDILCKNIDKSCLQIDSNKLNLGHYTTNIKSLIITDSQHIPSYSQKVLFFAILKFIEKCNDFDGDKYFKWLRIVRNIVCQISPATTGTTDFIRSPETFVNAINLIEKLSNGCSDIYSYLLQHSEITKKREFSDKQIKEEILKINIITNNPNHLDLIYKLENHEMFLGRISFPIECVGYDNIDINSIDFNKLEILQTILENEFTKSKILTDGFRRAMLTIENNNNYRFYDYWWSSWNVDDKPIEKRRLLHKINDIEFCMSKDEHKIYIQKLMRELIEDNQHTIQSYIDSFLSQNRTHPNGMPNWQYRLIREPNLLKNLCDEKYIAIEDNCCYLLKTPRQRRISEALKIE